MKHMPLTLCLFLMFTPAFAYSAGPLTPPGSPAPTMKTLDEVEPRIPISTATTISAPGSYYLTQDLVGPGNTFKISASDVTLDLNGFRFEANGLGNGIWVADSTSQLRNVTIKNGTISGFGRGVQCNNVVNSEFSDLKIWDASGEGIRLVETSTDNSGNVIRRCSIRDCGIGISLSGGICRGNLVEDCRIVGSTNDGILLGFGGGTVTGNRILRCEVSDSVQSGIKSYAIPLSDSASAVVKGNEIRECVISGTGAEGIVLGASGLKAGCHGNVVRDCVISNTGAEGIEIRFFSGATCDGNVIQSCTVRDALGSGISASGTRYSRIEGNHVSLVATGFGGSHGIFVSGSNNFVVRNTCGGASDNIDIAATNTYGPEVNVTGALSNTGDASHPLANFNLQ